MPKTCATTAYEPSPDTSAGTFALTSMSRLLPDSTRPPSSRSIRRRLSPGLLDPAGLIRSTFDRTSANVFFGTFTVTDRLPRDDPACKHVWRSGPGFRQGPTRGLGRALRTR